MGAICLHIRNCKLTEIAAVALEKISPYRTKTERVHAPDLSVG